ncbi:hypothetical protein [Neisseria animalis]|uniref:GAF domain-containing protein n=1 Tax=Neisseria animalis TaxID=492 RepID=A0A5P3MPH3_NEIAN|nr:hypothetical protein [Neisseria animalis]QEY23442.1 hypothetical protein D0T90_02125 [Neisseria animalis]ROW33287.1 hypothetical protein CGZ60_00870 [Neisseria animalis]VEE08947.1 Uncharacterised protein [Neisseria animalis]
MPASLIKDYLQTQGLKLPQDEVQLACAGVRAVMDLGNASIDRSVLWYEHDGVRLADHVGQNAEHEVLLKQIYMALDSVYSRSKNVRSAVVYALMPSANSALGLVCLSRQGELIEHILTVDGDSSRSHLAGRTAQSGWLNLCNDTAYWLENGELEGERNQACGSQISAPVCTRSGAVLGVVHIEFEGGGQADEAAQIQWTALALELSEPLKKLLNIEDNQEDTQDD